MEPKFRKSPKLQMTEKKIAISFIAWGNTYIKTHNHSNRQYYKTRVIESTGIITSIVWQLKPLIKTSEQKIKAFSKSTTRAGGFVCKMVCDRKEYFLTKHAKKVPCYSTPILFILPSWLFTENSKYLQRTFSAKIIKNVSMKKIWKKLPVLAKY